MYPAVNVQVSIFLDISINPGMSCVHAAIYICLNMSHACITCTTVVETNFVFKFWVLHVSTVSSGSLSALNICKKGNILHSNVQMLVHTLPFSTVDTLIPHGTLVCLAGGGLASSA